MMKSILFYDVVSPKPYNFNSLSKEPLGGTEATVIRVGKALPKEHLVGVTYLLDNQNSDTIVTLRSPVAYTSAKKHSPRAKHILWLHDYISGTYQQELIDLINTTNDVEVVLVSEFHKHNFIDALKDRTDLSKVKIHVIYNPVVVDGFSSLETNTNKLVFFSSPHKGLEYALAVFKMIHRLDSDMRLYVANPGYMTGTISMDQPGVINLGSLTHSAMMAHLSDALCVFYPNYKFPETFGLVMAEANALGVPVLTHPLAAAREVLSHPKELMDVRDYKAVVDRVLDWKAGDRPTVKANPAFALDVVIKQWEKIL